MSDIVVPPAAGYRFCDTALRLTANDPSVVARFEAAYGARQEADERPGAPSVTCHIEVDESGQGHIAFDGRSHPLPLPDPGNLYAFGLVVDAVAAASRSHLFLHASSVLTRSAKAVFAGPSGSGKSTLAEALVHRGAGLLADDVTPVARAVADGGRVHVFLLRPATKATRFRYALDAFPAAWAADPPWGPENGVSVVRRDAYWELEAVTPRPGAPEALRRACHEAGVLILRELATETPRFGSAPALAPLSPTAALPLLLAEVMGRGTRAGTELLWSLSEALDRATFWRLAPGPPDLTAETVIRALQGRATASPAG